MKIQLDLTEDKSVRVDEISDIKINGMVIWEDSFKFSTSSVHRIKICLEISLDKTIIGHFY